MLEGTTSSAGSDVVSLAQEVPFVEFEVTNNTLYQADTFFVSFAVSALPANRGADWFAAQQEIKVRIYAGFPANPDKPNTDELKNWIYGKADSVEYDPVARVIYLSGRDFTAQMIDTKTTERYINNTASEIATIISSKYGLGTTNIVATTTKAGNYYQIDHAQLSNQRSEWDLLCYLAQQEQFRVYVRGEDLYFEPLPDKTAEPYALQWNFADTYQFNGTRMRFSRNLTLARGAQVTVRSWNQKTKKLVAVVYPSTAAANAQKYIYNIANLTQEQALAQAQALHKQVTQHEVNMQADLPADDILTAQNIISVTGTGTAYDQTYYPSSVSRRMSMDQGYTMSVIAKNHSPQNEVQL